MKIYYLLYSYFENELSKENLNFFIKNGLSNNENINFIFIISGNKCSINIPKQKNITILFKNNTGHDFAAWSVALKEIKDKKKYDVIIFMNDTVIGPYLPRYIPKNIHWYEMFCNLLSDKVKLSGLTINYYPWDKEINSEHVQSMIFCLDKTGLDIVYNKIFNLKIEDYNKIYKKSKRDYIIRFEIGLSKEIINNKYEISALYMCDSIKLKTGDIWHNNKYFNSNINPFETMFIKNNRINSPIIDLYTNILK